MWMEQIARNWLVWELTGSGLALGFTNLARSLPQMFMALPAGVVADRFNKKWVLLACQTVSFSCYVTLFLLVVTDAIQLWHIYLFTAIMGSSMAFNQPARQSLVPRLVPPEALLNAVSLNMVAMNTTRVLGPALAGLLIGLWDVDAAYGAAMVIFSMVLVATVMLRASEARSLNRGGSARGQLFEGVSYVVRNPSILAIMAVALATFTFAMPYNTILPIVADDVFHIGPAGYGLLLSVAGAGALAGGIGMAALGDFPHKGKLFLVAAGSFGFFIAILGLSPWVVVAFAAMLLIGASQSIFMAAGSTVILKMTPPNLQGRVMSVYSLDHALMPLGSAMAGGLADAFSASVALVALGIICTSLVLTTGTLLPAARRA